MSIQTITHAMLRKVIHASRRSLNSLYIEGPPGVGKSMALLDYTIEHGMGFGEKRGCQLESYHMEGIYVPDHERQITTSYACADWPTVKNVERGLFKPEGIFVIEELPTAPAHVAPHLLGLMNERTVKGEKIAPGWVLAATGNRIIDKSGARTMLQSEFNRMGAYSVECPFDSWVTWAITHGVRTEIIAYFAANPMHLNECLMTVADPNNYGAVKPKVIPPNTQFTSPRSASHCSKEIDGWHDGGNGAPPMQVYQAHMGPIVGPDCYAMCQLAPDTADYEDIVAAPNTTVLPQTTGGVYRTLYMLAQRATVKNLKKVLTYADRIQQSGVAASSEFLSCFWTLQNKEEPNVSPLIKTVEYNEWLEKQP